MTDMSDDSLTDISSSDGTVDDSSGSEGNYGSDSESSIENAYNVISDNCSDRVTL